MSFTIKQPKTKSIKIGLPLIFIDNVHFLNNSLDNLVKNSGENDFYHLRLEFNVDALDLVTTGIALKNLSKVYLTKINFIIH